MNDLADRVATEGPAAVMADVMRLEPSPDRQSAIEVFAAGGDAAVTAGEWELIASGMADDLVYDGTRVRVDGPVAHGFEGWRDSLLDVTEPWSEWRVEALDVIDGGGDSFVVQHRWTAIGRSSGAETSVDRWSVHTMRDGRLARLVEFVDREEALAALSERTGR